VVIASSRDEDAGAGTILSELLTTMLVFWLAHVYARFISSRLDRPGEPLLADLRRSIREEWPVGQAAIVPALALGLGAVGILSRDTAVTLAIGLGVVALAGWGFAIARRARLDLARTLGVAAVNATLGLLLVGMNVAVH
jgi:hypothetical protein